MTEQRGSSTHPVELRTPEKFDVVAVNIKTAAQRVMKRDLSIYSADAFIRFAVMRRGVDEEFYKAVPAGSVP
jgi:hypothetical protein